MEKTCSISTGCHAFDTRDLTYSGPASDSHKKGDVDFRNIIYERNLFLNYVPPCEWDATDRRREELEVSRGIVDARLACMREN
jgi:hypothetical protein